MALSSAERAVLKYTDNLLSDAKSAKERLGVTARAQEYRRVYDGPGQWRGNRPPSIFVNFVKNFMQRKVAALTDSKPETLVVSRRQDYGGPAKVLHEATKSLWPHLNLHDTFSNAALMGGIDGVVGFSTEWDPEAEYGQGQICVEVYPVENIHLDPAVTVAGDLQKGQYVILEDRVPIQGLIDRYGARGQLVTPDKAAPITRTLRPGGRRLLSPIEQTSRPTEDDTIPRATRYRVQFKDTSTNADGSLKYPGGRFVTRTKSLVLEDTQNPNWDGHFTVDLWAWNQHYSNPWGESDVAIMRKSGEGFNRILDLMLRNMINTGNTVYIGDFDALDPNEWNKLDNLEGLTIKKRVTRELRREAPPAYPPHYYQILTFLPQIMETLIGLIDIAPGGRRLPAQSMGAFEGFMQQAMSLIRQTSRLLETTVQRIGFKMISRIIQYYTSDRVFSIVGPSQEFMQYVFKRAALLTSDKSERIMVTNRDEHIEFLRQFQYLVVPNSGLLMNRIQRVLIAQQLLQAHIVDRKYVAETLGPELLPDWENVLKRATAEMIQQAQLGMQQRPQRGVRSNRRGTMLSVGQT